MKKTWIILMLLMTANSFGVTITVNGSPVAASIGSAREVDWYSFVVSTSGAYTMQTTAGTLTDTYMYLYGPGNQTTLIEEDDDDGVGNASLITRSLSPGTYYLKVRAYSSTRTGTYSIRVTGSTTPPSSGTVSLTLNASATSASISSAGEVDWYRFVVSTSGTYTMDTTAGTLTDTYMYLYGPGSQTTLIEEDDDDGIGNAARIIRSLSPGTYYLKVRAYSSTQTGTYRVQVSGTTTPPTSGIVWLTVNGNAASASLASAGEVDWYSFVVNATGSYTMDTTAGTLADNYMYLYGPGNQTTLIEEDDDDGVGNAARIVRTLSPGTYYLKVRAYSSSSTGTYTIFVTRVTNGPEVTSFAVNNGASSASSRSVVLNNACTGSPTQYIASESSSFSGAAWQTYSTAPSFTLSSGNGTKSVYFKVRNSSGQESVRAVDSITLSELSVLPLPLGQVYSASISISGESDWYSFAITTACTVTIDTISGTLADTYMYLYGPGNQTTLIEEDDDDGEGNASLITRSLSAGTYYVKVRAYSSSQTGTYNIRWRLGGSGVAVTWFAINGGTSEVTSSRNVTLNNISSGSPTHYMASESSSFSGATWQAYSTSFPPFTLSSGNGVKYVYFKVKNATGQESASVVDTITLNEVTTQPTLLTVGASPTSASISAAGENDWFRFVVPASGTYRIETTSGTLSDTYMYLYGPGNQTTLIEEDDDDGVGYASMISRTLSAGTYYAKIQAYSSGSTGTYTIRVTRPEPTYTIQLDSNISSALIVGQSVQIRGTLMQNGAPAANLSFSVCDGIAMMCRSVTTNSLGRFSFTTTPAALQASLVQFVIGSQTISAVYDVRTSAGMMTPVVSAIQVQNTTSSPFRATVTSPFGNQLAYTIQPGETRQIVNTTGTPFTFHPTAFSGTEFMVGLPVIGDATVATTVNTDGVAKIKITGGTAVLVRFSAYTTSQLDAGVCWSPGGSLGAGAGASISGSICLGTDGFNVGGSVAAGVVTGGFSVQLMRW